MVRLHAASAADPDVAGMTYGNIYCQLKNNRWHSRIKQVGHLPHQCLGIEADVYKSMTKKKRKSK